MICSWRQTRRAWSDYDAVIIRSTWDYWGDTATFLSTLEDINRQLRNYDSDSTTEQDAEGKVKLGLGIYYIEEKTQ